jgi:hypothetical protein
MSSGLGVVFLQQISAVSLIDYQSNSSHTVSDTGD